MAIDDLLAGALLSPRHVPVLRKTARRLHRREDRRRGQPARGNADARRVGQDRTGNHASILALAAVNSAQQGARLMTIKQEHRVEVENGKYTFVVPSHDDHVYILRHGESWYTPEVGQPSRALHAIMCELDAARVVIQAARELVRNRTALDSDERLVAALTKHAALTGDHAPPSPWTGEASNQFRAQPEAEKIVDPVHQLMRINAQMFEGTIRVLGQQNRALHEQVEVRGQQNRELHEQVEQLTTDNVNLRRELEAARPKIP